jgi:hypothetical protein
MGRRSRAVLLGVVLVLGLCEVGVRAGAPHLPDPAPWPSPESRIKAAQMEDSGCARLVFLGTSVTEAAVNPQQLGDSTYNAALPFSTIRSVEYWAQHFVLPELCPETVVLGIPTWSTEFAFGSGPEGLLTGLQNVHEFRHPEDWMSRVLNRSELVRRRRQLKSLVEQWSPAVRPERTGLIGPQGNQIGYTGRTIGSFPRATIGLKSEPFDRKGLIDLVERIRSSGVNAVLMVEPARCAPSGVCPDDAVRTAILQHYEAVATQFDIAVIDVWDDFDPALYADTSHFNDGGTRQFTELLSNELGRLGVMP